MSAPSIWDRFPDMRPVTKPPTLYTVNGIGTTVVGGRDHDPDTGTYVKTVCIAVLFIPVLPLSAYRVADAPEGGWYFIGKVPLSPFARTWGLLLLLLAVGGGGWGAWAAYTGTPEYKANHRLAEADRLMAAGQVGQAVPIYKEVAGGPVGPSGQARTKLVGLLDNPPPGEDGAAAYRAAVELQHTGNRLVPDLFDRGRKQAEQRSQSDPRAALALLDAVAPVAPRVADLDEPRRKVLERLVEQDPKDPAAASRLATIYEARGQGDRCEKLLAPHADRLGPLDGAAILGRIWADKGKHDQAQALLGPYVEARLPRLHAAEKAYETAQDAAEKRAIDQLQSGLAPGFDYQLYQRSAKPEQMALVRDFVTRALQADTAFRRAQDALRAETAVVGAALELGTVLLQRAQGQPDPARRRADLEKAEKTFVSVRGTAGDTDAYRLHLGQVYYWLGKPRQGRSLFDELLKQHRRDTQHMLTVSQTLREVGAVSEARNLAEEAYRAEKDVRKKQLAAVIRALMFTDLDDEIVWLDRADPADLHVRANLAEARGYKAQEDGRDDAAAEQFRQAIALYDQMPQSAASLNNCALTLFALHRVRPERDTLLRALDKLDRAVALQPGDSILLTNAASAALESALRDVIGPALDWKLLQRAASFDELAYLYKDEATRQAYVRKVKDHPGIDRARRYLDKLLLIAPKSPTPYSLLNQLYHFTSDAAALRSLANRLQGGEIDLEQAQAEGLLDLDQQTREELDFYVGKLDAKRRDQFTKALARQEKNLPAARKLGGATFALLATSLEGTRMALAELGQPADADALVKLAEEADRAAPSAGSRSLLMGALRFRAHHALARSEPAYAALARATGRSLNVNLLTWVLGHDGPVREKALALPDVRRVVDLELEQDRAFPKDPGLSEWASLRFARPDEAAHMARTIRADPMTEPSLLLDRALSPVSASSVLREHWFLLLCGKQKEADEVVRRAAARGIPLPTPGS
jgi:hypothetical protein